MYTQTRNRVMLELKDVEHFACMTDLWSSRTTEPYIRLTVHYIDQGLREHFLLLPVLHSLKTKTLADDDEDRADTLN